METVNIAKLEGSRCANVTKKVPIITDEVLASILFVHPNKNKLVLRAMDSDMIYYIIKGSGKVTIGSETHDISRGSLILVPKTKIHFYSTSDDRLVVLCVRSIKDYKEN